MPEKERAAHLRTFEQLKPVEGKLSGANARACFMKSKLPKEDLADIWYGRAGEAEARRRRAARGREGYGEATVEREREGGERERGRETVCVYACVCV